MRVTTETKYRAVARYLAMGIPLDSICANLGLSLDRWRVIINEPIFKSILAEVQDLMDEKLGEAVSEDPIFIRMKMARKPRIELLLS